MQAYIFFGLAGSGKGTQRDLLESLLKQKGKAVLAIEIGRLLREYAESGDAMMKKQLAEVMRSGELVPTAFPVALALNALIEQQGGYNCVMFDGLGRKRIEADILIELLLFFPDTQVHSILLDISEEEALKRLLKRGRTDDVESAIQTRFSLFRDTETGTTASLNFVRNHPDVIFHTVDGAGTVEEVHDRIAAALNI